MEKIFFKKLGSGWPVILIHGFCETHEIWNGFAEKLSEKCEVFVIDLPGFGNSPLPQSEFKINDIGRIILDWIHQKNILRPIVVGHSLGGYVALSMAKQSPQEFSGLGLFQSTAYPDSDERKINRSRVIEFVQTHGTSPFIDTYVPGLFYNKNHPSISVVDKIAQKTAKETLIAYTVAMRERESSIEFIKTFKEPFLILGGENDNVIPPKISRELGRLVPNPIVQLFKDTGHMAMYERSTEAVNAVKDFVGKIAEQGGG